MPLNDRVEPQTPPDVPTIDCLNLPDAPIALNPVLRARGYHDVALDQTGHVIGHDGSALVQVDRQGNTRPYAPGILGVEGMDWLPDGSLVAASSQGLVRIAPRTADELSLIPGMWSYRVSDYGADVLALVAADQAAQGQVTADQDP